MRKALLNYCLASILASCLQDLVHYRFVIHTSIINTVCDFVYVLDIPSLCVYLPIEYISLSFTTVLKSASETLACINKGIRLFQYGIDLVEKSCEINNLSQSSQINMHSRSNHCLLPNVKTITKVISNFDLTETADNSWLLRKWFNRWRSLCLQWRIFKGQFELSLKLNNGS